LLNSDIFWSKAVERMAIQMPIALKPEVTSRVRDGVRTVVPFLVGGSS
jgi:hypothetical protein